VLIPIREGIFPAWQQTVESMTEQVNGGMTLFLQLNLTSLEAFARQGFQQSTSH
jgi:hypothetical protein